MKYDEATGLPELPANLFWRLGRDSIGNPKLTIMGRKQKKFLFWSWQITHETRFYTWLSRGVSKAELQSSAEYLIRKRNEWLSQNQDLFGDYPPKTLRETVN